LAGRGLYRAGFAVAQCGVEEALEYLSIQPAVGTLSEKALAGNPFPMGQPTAPNMVFETK
jgi:hypothetical protein